MSKIHVNPNTGETGVCTAGQGTNPTGCPFGGTSGTENHFDTLSDAKNFSEQLMTQKHGSFNTHNAKNTHSNSNNMTSPDLWDSGTSEGVELDEDGRVVDVHMPTYVSAYLGMSVSDLPPSVTQLIEQRGDSWKDGFSTEVVDDEDDYGNHFEFHRVEPSGSLIDDLADHYHDLNSK